jgi:hypothetical protein
VIAAGMVHLHSCGIVHYDLKPSTVLLNDQFKPMLTVERCSTLFMGPEMGEDRDGGNFAVNVYAFAVTIYQQFTDKSVMDDGSSTGSSFGLTLRTMMRPSIDEVEVFVNQRTMVSFQYRAFGGMTEGMIYRTLLSAS